MKVLFNLALAAFCSASLLAQTPCENGMAGEYPCENVDLWSFIPLDDLDAVQNLNDIWGWTDENSGREFAIVGMRNGTSFVEVTDPENPVYLGFLETHTNGSLWRDVKVYQDHAYIVAEAGFHGMQVLELTQLLTITEPPVVFNETAHYGGFGNSHNIVINEETGYAYGVGTSTFNGGLHIVNIQDPANPVIAGEFAEDGYTHDAQVVVYRGSDADYFEREIAFACNENTLTIVDVEDKSDAQLISATGYEDNGYSHQGWLTEDHKYFLKNDELDEINGFTENTRTYIWDVRDLDNPVLAGIYEGVATSIDHNLYNRWSMSFQSNYRSGLRILNLAKISEGNLNEIGYFDVQPSDDDAEFSGTWSNYCYFPSGTVVVTDMYTGLFILRPRVATADYLVEAACAQDAETVNAYISYDAATSAVSIDGLPTGVQATVGTYTLPGAIPIELTGLSTLAAGDYPYTYNVEFDDQTVTLDGLIMIEDTATPTISELSPSGTSIDPSGIVLSWEASLENGQYFVQVAEDNDFTSIVFDETTNETSVEITFDLPDGTYFWRVTGTGEGNCEENVLSQTEEFTVIFIGIEGMDAQNMVIFPNPATDQLQVIASQRAEHVYVHAMDGRLVDAFILSGRHTLQINLQDYSAGAYILSDDLGNRTSVIVR